MKNMKRGPFVLIVVAATLAACATAGPSGEPGAAGENVASTEQALGPQADHSLGLAEKWAEELAQKQGWNERTPRMLADVDNDKKQDVVGFGSSGVWVARSTGSSFTPFYALADFGTKSGWSIDRHVRLMGDIDRDGRDDIVGFGDDGVYVSRSLPTGFEDARLVIKDFGYNQGWRVAEHVRVLADIDADGMADIVAFGHDGIWVARANGDGNFELPRYVLAEMGTDQGWSNLKHIRTVTDVDGDGRADVVGFGDAGTYVARSNGTGFDWPTLAIGEFGYIAGGWRPDINPRVLADINGDGKKDVVGFGSAGVYTSLWNGSGFAPQVYSVADFGSADGWKPSFNPRLVGDVNGDGYSDIVGFGSQAIMRSRGGPTGFSSSVSVLRDFTGGQGFYNDKLHPRFLGDVDGDGLADVVAIDSSSIRVARSSSKPPPAAPNAPSRLFAKALSSSAIRLMWSDNSSNETEFIIGWHKAGAPRSQTSSAANTVTYDFTSLGANTKYCFDIAAVTQFAVSATTYEACATTDADTTTPPGNPGGPPSRTVCGVSLRGCPAGYHPDYFQFSQTCPGAGIDDNQTLCAKNLSTYHACGIPNCAPGYHAIGFDYSVGCSLSANIDDNASTCQLDSTMFAACGSCPAGYALIASTTDASCAPYMRVTCRKP